jgi:hypothetical protein
MNLLGLSSNMTKVPFILFNDMKRLWYVFLSADADMQDLYVYWVNEMYCCAETFKDAFDQVRLKKPYPYLIRTFAAASKENDEYFVVNNDQDAVQVRLMFD